MAQLSPKAAEINLLGQATRGSGAVRFQSVAKRVSFVVLGVYFLVLLGIFGTNLFLSRQESTLVNVGNKLAASIAGQSSTETLLSTIKNRVSIAGGITNKSDQAPEKLLSEVASVLPNDVQINELTAQPNKFNLVLSVPSSRTLSDLFKLLSTSQFSLIELDSLSLDSSGVYTASINIR